MNTSVINKCQRLPVYFHSSGCPPLSASFSASFSIITHQTHPWPSMVTVVVTMRPSQIMGCTYTPFISTLSSVWLNNVFNWCLCLNKCQILILICVSSSNKSAHEKQNAIIVHYRFKILPNTLLLIKFTMKPDQTFNVVQQPSRVCVPPTRLVSVAWALR